MRNANGEVMAHVRVDSVEQELDGNHLYSKVIGEPTR